MPAETHSASSPPERDDLLLLLEDIVAEVVGPRAEPLRSEQRLVDVGIDDLALLDLIDALEEELGERTVGLSIDEDPTELTTVGDVLDLLESVPRRGETDE